MLYETRINYSMLIMLISIMTEGPTTQSFFQGDNKTYFIHSKNTETYYDVQLFTNWMK